jgi:hypothetical protein
MLNLNETQAGVLQLVFKIADDERPDAAGHEGPAGHAASMVGDNASEFTTQYGNVSAASIGAIQRGLMQIESQGGEQVLWRAHAQHRATSCRPTVQRQWRGQHPGRRQADAPRHACTPPSCCGCCPNCSRPLPEVGDLDKPKLVFFFDEAHLLFTDAPKALVERIELVVRLVRSKGVGVYFVTQNPLDIPDSVLAQLGNRVQHALRAYTPRDQKAVKATAETMRQKPGLDIATAITELAVGEALVSLLDEKGRPGITERVYVLPPGSQIGPITPAQRQDADRRIAGGRCLRKGGGPRVRL